MRVVDPIGLAKAVLWEQAKGLLRAMVAADGAEQSRGSGFPPHFEKVEEAVETFIKAIEDEGLHE